MGDLRTAFDKMSHNALSVKLLNGKFPVQLININVMCVDHRDIENYSLNFWRRKIISPK